ncbi:rhamnosyltransferase [Aeromonas caviae]|uniref:Rhamnosyltransferase n=1 Tax=Aeromonas caviae TaxID=648 RepID=A0ABD0BBY4_AERCA|nr:glycosyltransferase family 2 protein [Aeromonas caviae]WDV29638.1 glycosyltransferase family 2 protein [Aeromonas caviae]BCR28499.1 rhamnosyltransferase [Aeromonas caviae]GJA82814.1 rhamnosyltransferase [Aeromonas caviae]GJA99565.1 rhamnosyltransferase [Aeromonas caviae]GJB12925.1 rhamnosyltransferase [Aeromonas caviae]
MISPSNISAVIVSFNPEVNKLQKLIDSLFIKVKEVIIVDNSHEEFNLQSKLQCNENLVLLSDGKNKGIAQAQNIGILFSRDLGRDAVWMFDQDSELGDLSLEIMVEELNSFGSMVASIGPTIVNSFNRRIEIPKKRSKCNNGCFSVDQIIASGSLTPLNVFEHVGMMEEDFFIDAVDFEWCWRARGKGYAILISSQRMIHSVGEGDETFLGGLVSIKVASPFRLYYQVRNYITLLDRSYVPMRWKLRNLVFYFIKFFYFGFGRSDSTAYRYHIISGLRDGMKMRYNRK